MLCLAFFIFYFLLFCSFAAAESRVRGVFSLSLSLSLSPSPSPARMFVVGWMMMGDDDGGGDEGGQQDQPISNVLHTSSLEGDSSVTSLLKMCSSLGSR